MKKVILPLLVVLVIMGFSACSKTGGKDYTSATIGTLKYVPAGRFQINSNASNIAIISKPFRMSQFEITRAQFKAVMGVDPSDTDYSSGTDDPVQCVNWYQAIAFCNKLSLAEGLKPVYSVTEGGNPINWEELSLYEIPIEDDADWNAVQADWSKNGYRLPSEMEWMWAAMGAPADGQGRKTNATGYLKAFAGSTGSNNLGDYAVFGYGFKSETGRTDKKGTKQIGSKQANELGLHDMSGNVWEWCWDQCEDWEDAYPDGTLSDYYGTSSGRYRVRRGGSWYYDAVECGVASRDDYGPSWEDDDTGFRVVRN